RPASEPAASYSIYLRLLYGVLAMGFPPALLQGFEQALPTLSPDDRSPFAEMIRGSVGSHRRWFADDEARHKQRAVWAEFFRDVDVLVCPIMPVAAFPHDHSPFETRTIDVDGRKVPYLDLVFWAGLFVLAGVPATVVPIGRTRAGLPVGMQVISAPLEDRARIRFAKCLEDVLGGFVPPPGFSD